VLNLTVVLGLVEVTQRGGDETVLVDRPLLEAVLTGHLSNLSEPLREILAAD
jgi:hypothetical protein